MRPLLRAIAFAFPALTAYLLVAPLACRYLDGRFGWGFGAPIWLLCVGGILMLAGAVLAGWTLCLFAWKGNGTPNPLAPPKLLVAAGPYRYSRNPMMLGGWVAGLGLGLVLGSRAFIGFCGFIVLMGSLYVRWIEEPKLLERFGKAYRSYMDQTPRWC